MNTLDIIFHIIILIIAFIMLFGKSTINDKTHRFDFVKFLAGYIIAYTVYNICKLIL